MITDYIKCPVLFAEYQKLDEVNFNQYISYLETRRYSHGTITAYACCVVHYFSWRRKVGENDSVDISAKQIRSVKGVFKITS